MACGGHRRKPRKTSTKIFPMVGEAGFMILKYIGGAPGTFFGEITNRAYSFNIGTSRYVDIRDAAYLLGTDFIEA